MLVDHHLKKKNANKNLTPEQLAAEGDKSPGVLLASGYIAGGAIAGIVIAFTAGFFPVFADNVLRWAKEYNPFFEGSWSNTLSLLPFILIGILLYLTGRDFFSKSGDSGRFQNRKSRYGRNQRMQGKPGLRQDSLDTLRKNNQDIENRNHSSERVESMFPEKNRRHHFNHRRHKAPISGKTDIPQES